MAELADAPDLGSGTRKGMGVRVPPFAYPSMKTEFTDVSETQKTLTIEIPSDVVDAEINTVAKDYSKQAKIPGFRPGKVPATVVKQRFKEQILHDVMHGLIPRAVEEALQERGIEPVDTPNIKDVALEEGQPLKFTAAIETVPAFDPGDLSHAHRDAPVGCRHRRRGRRDAAAAARAGGEVRAGRGSRRSPTATRLSSTSIGRTRTARSDRHENVSIELGAPANPPGFDANLIGLERRRGRRPSPSTFPTTTPSRRWRTPTSSTP